MLWKTRELDGHFMHTFYRRSVGAVCPLHFYQTFGRRAVDALKNLKHLGVAFIILASVNLLFTLKKMIKSFKHRELKIFFETGSKAGKHPSTL